MSTIVAAISGQFTRALVLSGVLPAALFCALVFVIVGPIVPNEATFLDPLAELETQWQVIVFAFVVLLLSTLLFNLNTSILRIYEGYPWQKSLLGQGLTKLQKRRYRTVKAREAGLRAVLRHADRQPAALAADARNKVIGYRSDLQRVLNLEFPRKEDRVLPTRLGNVIRAYEDYPKRQYNISSVTMWPRLYGVLDSSYVAALDDAKISFDFMLNSSLVFALLAAVILVAGLLYPEHLEYHSLPIRGMDWEATAPWLWIGEVVGCAVLSYLFYLRSIPRARTWGEVVKGAFDLYRWKLLTQLGYQPSVIDRAIERDAWERISFQTIFGDTPTGPRIDYLPDLALVVAPADIGLTTLRSVRSAETSGTVECVVQVKNRDSRQRRATKIAVWDTVPDGYHVVTDSARSMGRAVTVTGAGPYRFAVNGTLEFGAELTITYCIAAATSG